MMIRQIFSFEPKKWMTFIELNGFSDDWNSMGFGDDDLLALQLSILAQPKRPPVVKGTGGLRKLRFASKRKGKGKSKAARFGYVYLEKYGIILLVVAYSKNEKADLSRQEIKLIRQLLEKIEKDYSRRKSE